MVLLRPFLQIYVPLFFIILPPSYSIGALHLERKWVRPTIPLSYKGEYTNTINTPILYKNKIISANNVEGIQSFYRRLGVKSWSQKIKSGVSSPILKVSHFLFFSSYEGYLYSLNGDNGKIFWKKNINYPSTHPLFFDDGHLFIQTHDSRVLCLKASSGEEVWSYKRKNRSHTSIHALGTFGSLGSLLIVGFSNGSLVALEKKSGQIRWERQLNFNRRFRDVKAIYIFNGDQILAAGYDDHIYRINGLDGVLIWRKKIPVVTHFIELNEKKICFGTSDQYIQCINPQSGHPFKKHKISSNISQIAKINSETLMFGKGSSGNGGLEILNVFTDHKVFYPTGGQIYTAPVWDKKPKEFFSLQIMETFTP